MTVKSMVEEFPGSECAMKVVDLQGVTHKVKVSGMHLERIAQVSGVYCLPKEFKWFPMEGFEEVSSKSARLRRQNRRPRKTDSPVKLLATG